MSSLTIMLFSHFRTAGCYGRQQYDKCGLLCDCVYHRLRNCRRIRKEFTSMTTSERIRYIKTVITVSTRSPHKEKYDMLIDAHRRLFSTGIFIVFSLLQFNSIQQNFISMVFRT